MLLLLKGSDLLSFILVAGGKVHGPRGPNSYFFMLPKPFRILGLQVALSVKYSQVIL